MSNPLTIQFDMPEDFEIIFYGDKEERKKYIQKVSEAVEDYTAISCTKEISKSGIYSEALDEIYTYINEVLWLGENEIRDTITKIIDEAFDDQN